MIVTTEMENDNTGPRQHGAYYYQDIVVARRAFDPTCFDTPREEFPAPGQVADGHVGFVVSCAPEGSMDLGLNSPDTGARTALHITAATDPADCLPGSS